MITTRRDFLKLLGLGVATATLTASGIEVVKAEPVRRYWQVGAQLQKSDGLRPIEGQPGFFRDPATGQVIRLSDFRESDRYDTIIIAKNSVADGLWQARVHVANPTQGRVEIRTVPGSSQSIEEVEGQPGVFREPGGRIIKLAASQPGGWYDTFVGVVS